MKHQRSKSKQRKARGNSDYGLVRRVAARLGKSERWISDVKNGVYPQDTAAAKEVLAAIEQERELMRKESHAA